MTSSNLSSSSFSDSEEGSQNRILKYSEHQGEVKQIMELLNDDEGEQSKNEKKQGKIKKNSSELSKPVVKGKMTAANHRQQSSGKMTVADGKNKWKKFSDVGGSSTSSKKQQHQLFEKEIEHQKKLDELIEIKDNKRKGEEEEISELSPVLKRREELRKQESKERQLLLKNWSPLNFQSDYLYEFEKNVLGTHKFDKLACNVLYGENRPKAQCERDDWAFY